MISTNIKPVDKKELDSMLQEAIEQVKLVGAEPCMDIKPKVRVYKATSYLGLCRMRDNQFEITISEYHLKNGYQAVMKTMVHEVIHTVEGCLNHGDKWKRIANKVNTRYGYDIARVGNKEHSHTIRKAAKPNMKYQIQCEKCGNIWYRQKLSKLVKHPEIYRCGCGGILIRIK